MWDGAREMASERTSERTGSGADGDGSTARRRVVGSACVCVSVFVSDETRCGSGVARVVVLCHWLEGVGQQFVIWFVGCATRRLVCLFFQSTACLPARRIGRDGMGRDGTGRRCELVLAERRTRQLGGQLLTSRSVGLVGYYLLFSS